MHPVRPGEYVLMDTTYLDVYAMDQHTLRWVGVDLTVAMDWYSRCIIGLRLTPMSTKAIDAASVLYQAFRLCRQAEIGRPKLCGRRTVCRDPFW
jgi:transposase InsO family protein